MKNCQRKGTGRAHGLLPLNYCTTEAWSNAIIGKVGLKHGMDLAQGRYPSTIVPVSNTNSHLSHYKGARRVPLH